MLIWSLFRPGLSCHAYVLFHSFAREYETSATLPINNANLSRAHPSLEGLTPDYLIRGYNTFR